MTDPVAYDPPVPNAALVVGPDDVLVIMLPTPTSQDEYRQFRDALPAELSGRVLLVANVDGMAVVRGSDTPLDPASAFPPGGAAAA